MHTDFSRVFVYLLAFTLATSGVVRIEPAPYDLLVVGLLLLGLATNLLRFSPNLLLPSLLILVFLVSNMVSLVSNMVSILSMQEGFEAAARAILIRVYLAMSWFLFVGVLWTYGRQGFQFIWLGYLVAAITSSLLGTLGALGIPFFSEYFVLNICRAAGFFKDPNVFAPFLVPAGLYAVYRWYAAAGRRERTLWASFFVILTVGILLALSRAAWLNVGVALTTFLLILPGVVRFRDRMRIVSWLGVLALIFALILISNPMLASCTADRLGLKDYDQKRFETQAAALYMSLDNPLGIGPGQAERVFGYATHSLYLRVLVESGWMGFLAFMLLVILSLRRSLMNSRRGALWSRWMYALVAASLFGALVNSFFIDSLHWRHLWILLALAWGPHEAIASHHPR